MIPKFKTYLKESVWGDIRKKSIGQEIREEDNINNLDGRAFIDYLNQQYDSPISSSTGDSFVILYKGTITILLFYILDSAMMKTGDYVYLFYDLEKNVIYISEYSKIYKHPIFKKLCNKFDVKKKAYKSSMSNDTTIKPKDGDASKRFFMELIDFFEDNAEHPFYRALVKKNNVNESIWGNIRKKSLGQDIRNEDLINLDDLDNGTMDDLYNYVIQNYEYTKEPVSEYRSIRMLGNDLFIPITLDGKMLNTSLDSASTDGIEFIVVNNELVKYLDDEAYARYFDYVEKDNPDDDVTKIIVDGGYFPKRNVIGIIDALIDQVPNPALAKKEVIESVWGNVRNKSLGQEIRNEDEYEPDILESIRKRIETAIKWFVEYVVYCSKFKNDLDGFKEYINSYLFTDSYDFKLKKNGREIILPYIERNWVTGDKYKDIIDERIALEKKKVKDLGYVVKHISICAELANWWDSLDDDEKTKIGEDNGYNEYCSEYYSEGGSKTTELTYDDWWSNLSNYEALEIYMEYKNKTNESIWGNIRKKSLGQEKRIEDNINLMGPDDFVNYLNGLYDTEIKIKTVYENNRNYESISVLLLKTGPKGLFENWPISILYYQDYPKILFSNKKFPEMCPYLYNKLESDLTMKKDDEELITVVDPDGKKINNEFFIYVIDTIIKNLNPNEDNIIIKKKNDTDI